MLILFIWHTMKNNYQEKKQVTTRVYSDIAVKWTKYCRDMIYYYPDQCNRGDLLSAAYLLFSENKYPKVCKWLDKVSEYAKGKKQAISGAIPESVAGTWLAFYEIFCFYHQDMGVKCGDMSAAALLQLMETDENKVIKFIEKLDTKKFNLDVIFTSEEDKNDFIAYLLRIPR